jgi:DNA-binding transcriptional ArsR family regulator
MTRELQAFRAEYVGFPNAQRPPFVALGDTFASDAFWHGRMRTRFAEDWVHLWTDGKGVFAMADMDDAGFMVAIERLGRMRRVERFAVSGTISSCNQLRSSSPRLLDTYIASWQYRCMAIDEQSDPLGLTFSALADPTRRAILARLASGDADVSEIMKPFALSQPTISKHLKVLERAGLITRGRDAQRRPRKLVAVPLKGVAEWVEPYRRFWELKLNSLDDYLKDMSAKEKKRARKT